MMRSCDFIEPVSEKDLHEPNAWYLTHHGVYHKKKKKIRVVFNCSLKYKGRSLNDELLQGPDLSNNLIGVLIRFREEEFAVTGDIEKMFYQVSVPPQQRKFLRFIWLDGAGNEKVYQMKVHVFGATSSPSEANYALQQVARNDTLDTCVKHAILRNFYVDDLLKSLPSEEQALTFLKRTKTALSEHGFNLTGLKSS